ncbi:hypothetical protein [Nostoc sp.]|uniref:hypothetical protein n=1 Tax=Nostoc sp. TaxID=1180 RepID=UPI002FFB400F
MTIQGFEALSCMGTPEFNGAIGTSASQELPMGTESNTEDTIAVSVEYTKRLEVNF